MRLIAGFDLETTGLLAPEHRICEIALLLYDVDTEQRVGSLIRRFNPGRPIDPEAQAVHGITFEELAHHPLLEDSADTLDKIEKIARASQCWVAHNGDGFDMPFIAQEFVRVGRTLPMIKSFDTMLQGRWATPFGKNPSLKELCFACRVPYDPSLAHAAEYDVDRMMACYFFARKRGFFSQP